MKQLLSVFAVFAIIIFFSSCEGGWHDDDKATYLHTCHVSSAGMYTSDAQTDKYCQCNLDVVMKHYPHPNDLPANKDSVAVTKELQDCSVMARQ